MPLLKKTSASFADREIKIRVEREVLDDDPVIGWAIRASGRPVVLAAAALWLAGASA
jgi:hypothetical protein